MNKKGILKGSNRKEAAWNQTKLGEPFKEALNRFRTEVFPRDDFDPTSLLQFGLFLSMAVINILKEAEKKLGKEGQEVIINALLKTGYSMGNQILHDIRLPLEISDIKLMSFFSNDRQHSSLDFS